MNELSRKQKALLGMMAARAWARMSAVNRDAVCERMRGAANDPWMSEPKCMRAWKHEVQLRHGGVASAAVATQEHWRGLYAGWLHELGEDGKAMTQLMAADPDDEKRRQGLWHLRRECEARGLAYPEYPEAICRRQYRRELDEASGGQVWRLVFTVRMRRKKKSGV